MLVLYVQVLTAFHSFIINVKKSAVSVHDDLPSKVHRAINNAVDSDIMDYGISFADVFSMFFGSNTVAVRLCILFSIIADSQLYKFTMSRKFVQHPPGRF